MTKGDQTAVPPLTILDNPELKWMVISNLNLDALVHPHGPTLFQSGNNEAIKIIAISPEDPWKW